MVGKINGLQSNQLQSDTPPERVATEDLNFLEQAKKKLTNWWYTDSSAQISQVSLPAVPRVPVDTKTVAQPHVPCTKEEDSSLSNLWNFFWPKDKTVIPLPAKEINSQIRQAATDAKSEMKQALSALDIEYQQYLKEDPIKGEGVLVKVLVLLIKKQISLREEQEKLEAQQATNDKDKLKQVQGELTKKTEELGNATKLESKASTVTKVIGAAAAIAAFATVTVATGGAALGVAIPATVTTIAGYTTLTLNAAAAASLLVKEFLAGKTDTAKQESILLQAQKEFENEGVTKTIQELKTSLGEIAALWTTLKEVAEAEQKISSLNRRS